MNSCNASSCTMFDPDDGLAEFVARPNVFDHGPLRKSLDHARAMKLHYRNRQCQTTTPPECHAHRVGRPDKAVVGNAVVPFSIRPNTFLQTPTTFRWIFDPE